MDQMQKVLNAINSKPIVTEKAVYPKPTYVSLFEAIDKATIGIEEGVIPEPTDQLDEVQKKLYEMSTEEIPANAEEKADYTYLGSSASENYYAKVDADPETNEVRSIVVINSIDDEVANVSNEEGKGVANLINDLVTQLNLDGVNYQFLVDTGAINLEPDPEEIVPPGEGGDSSMPMGDMPSGGGGTPGGDSGLDGESGADQTPTPETPASDEDKAKRKDGDEKLVGESFVVAEATIKSIPATWVRKLSESKSLNEAKSYTTDLPKGSYKIVESDGKRHLVALVLEGPIVSSKNRYIVRTNDFEGLRAKMEKASESKGKNGKVKKITEEKQIVKARIEDGTDGPWVTDPIELKSMIQTGNSDSEFIVIYVENGQKHAELSSNLQGIEFQVGEEVVKVPVKDADAAVAPVEGEVDPLIDPVVDGELPEPITPPVIDRGGPAEEKEPEETSEAKKAKATVAKKAEKKVKDSKEGKVPDVTKSEPQGYIDELLEKYGLKEDHLDEKWVVFGEYPEGKNDESFRSDMKILDIVESREEAVSLVNGYKSQGFRMLHYGQLSNSWEEGEAQPSGTDGEVAAGATTPPAVESTNVKLGDGEGDIEGKMPKLKGDGEAIGDNKTTPASTEDAGGKANISKEGEGKLDNGQKKQLDKPTAGSAATGSAGADLDKRTAGSVDPASVK